jgi:hypothetical protein
MTVKTVSQARRGLADAGFVEELVADGTQLRTVSSAQHYAPEELSVARLVRFRGITAPEEEALLFAVETRDGQPLGTYVPPFRPAMPAADAAIVEQLHRKVIPDEEVRSHARHDHVAAVFDDRQAAQSAADELRQLGLGSDRLGIAVRESEPHAFERDVETELVRDTKLGIAAGGAVGLLAGMSIAAVALVPGGALGLGGILAIGAGSSLGGAMLGGYLGEAMADRAFGEREELLAAHLEPGQTLVAVCSHGHPSAVEAIMERHGGQLLLRPCEE